MAGTDPTKIKAQDRTGTNRGFTTTTGLGSHREQGKTKVVGPQVGQNANTVTIYLQKEPHIPDRKTTQREIAVVV